MKIAHSTTGEKLRTVSLLQYSPCLNEIIAIDCKHCRNERGGENVRECERVRERMRERPR